MQLKRRKKGMVWKSLGIVTANLFMATHGMAQTTTFSKSGNMMNEPAGDLGSTVIDSAALFYQESGGRVRVIEPVASLRITGESGNVLSARATYDSLTGASPNGAVPWDGEQVFTTPAPPPDEEMSVTSASGHTTIVTIPGTGTRVAQYTTPAHELPVDEGFKDTRYALDLGYAKNWFTNTVTSIGVSGSRELDFNSYSVNAAIAQGFNSNNTTLSFGVNYEYDQSDPLFGTPDPLTEMNGLQKGPERSKTVTSLKAGITQIMNRIWLVQLNYDIGWGNGYQNDPYKIVSVVDRTTGEPLEYLYESRPDSRVRQSVYLANKIAIGPTVADFSARYYHDSWGINSITAEVSEQVPLGKNWYVEPEFRYYRQSAADFFHYYILDGDSPEFASADGRLSRFSARTIGIKLGYQFTRNAGMYLMAEDYKQSGTSRVSGAPGGLADEDLFTGVHAKSLVLGFSFKFD